MTTIKEIEKKLFEQLNEEWYSEPIGYNYSKVNGLVRDAFKKVHESDVQEGER